MSTNTPPPGANTSSTSVRGLGITMSPPIPHTAESNSSIATPSETPISPTSPPSSSALPSPTSPPPSYTSHILSDIGTLAPVRFLETLIREDDDEVEQVEHFKYKQDLERKLTVTSVIGLGFSVMGVPFGLSSTLWISLMDGANVTILYGWIIVGFFSICVILSLSEISSKYPTAGGVYHFSAVLSNEKYSLVLSWFTGWFLLIGNWTYAISIMFSGAQFILSIFGLKDVYYKEDRFWVLGVFFLILGIVGFINFKFSRYLERVNKMCILWTIYTVLAIDFLLIFFAKRTNSIKEILTNFDNSRSGWPDPLAFIVGLQSSSFTLTGYGMLFSITDEVKKPEKNVPKGAVSAVFMATVTGIIFIIPILTILPELEVLLDETPNIMPIDLIFKLSTESYIISFLMACLMIGTVIFQSIGSLTTASRSTYALARDGGLPFAHLWTEVNSIEEYTIPRNALFLSMSVCAVLSLLSLISRSAFNAFMGAAVVSLTLANGLPILCLMLNKRKKIKGAAFKLGKLGWVINGISIFWVFLSVIILCMPPVIKNLTASNMNYAVLVIILFFAIASLGYRTWGQKSFTGPAIDTDYFELHNLESVGRANLATIDKNNFVVIGDDEDEIELKDGSNDKEEEEDIVDNGLDTKKSKKNGYQKLQPNTDEIEPSSSGLSTESENEVLFDANKEDAASRR
ncbi:Polyamine transporter TPO5 [Candida viswanathii]|uniref:Polyamine transporter TPO5 n=1 Tax=Candida viswanathii TaxID=5486 RepID=A0A367XMI2_9ASCO|nr:Polyamine transporter TPO5 [Candida viswanathii]